MNDIDFRVSPENYQHWELNISKSIAKLVLNVSESGGIRPGYELKLNSYDLGVDIELNDAIQRIRFTYPEVSAVIITSKKDRVFCAGANIGMLSQTSHVQKVNFCKFTNETRFAMEDASAYSSQKYICAINGACAGGGYELALACDYLVLLDDGACAISLPEIPLLAVLPGTGGLTRLVDKRHVQKDRADFFCTTEEGIRGERALKWGLVDELAPPSKWETIINKRAQELAEMSDNPETAIGVELKPLDRCIKGNSISYNYVHCTINDAGTVANITIEGPRSEPPTDLHSIHQTGSEYWPLQMTRELEDLILHLRFNKTNTGTWVIRTRGNGKIIETIDHMLIKYQEDWLIKEIILYIKRTFKRIDVSARSIFALVEPGSCFVGTLLELALAADRSYMLDGTFEDDIEKSPNIQLTQTNFDFYPMANGLARIASRLIGNPATLTKLEKRFNDKLTAKEAEELGLITFAPDDIDWGDETRLAIEERTAFSQDALTGMEASLRFAGPETIESKVFSRLTAWQNWIFQRPNAVGETGTLKLYGTGKRPLFDQERT